MVKNGNEKTPKTPKKYVCIICDYATRNKCDYSRHNLTPKHKNLCQMVINDNKKTPKTPNTNVCSCGKEYKFISGLSRHKLVCHFLEKNATINSSVVTQLLKDNQDFKEQIIALTEKNITQPVQNITNNNTHNNNVTFNLNYFLNTTCKNAINMKDFIGSINVNFNDLENTGKNGFVKNMTQVITRELGKLEACMRPIHCSDVKRKVLHIKDENAWYKDTDQCANTKKMVCSIAHKTNVMQIPSWVIANPRSQLYDDKLNDLYFKIVGNSMDGADETYDKIITSVSSKIHVGDSKSQMLLLK